MDIRRLKASGPNLALVLAILLAGAVFMVMTTPGPGFIGAGLIVALVGFLIVSHLRLRYTLEGSVLTKQGVLRRSRVDVAQALDLRVEGAGGVASLVITDAGGRMRVPLLMHTVYVHDGLPPDSLLALAGAAAVNARLPGMQQSDGSRMERANARMSVSRVLVGTPVVEILQAQAAHLASEGTLETSPLSASVR